jgi:hypothetical protein
MSKIMNHIMERNEEVIEDIENKIFSCEVKFDYDDIVNYLQKHLIATDKSQCEEIVQSIEDKIDAAADAKWADRCGSD